MGLYTTLKTSPNNSTTKPVVVFKPHDANPYDAKRALEQVMQRDPLLPVFNKTSVMTEIPEGIVGRNKMVIKHKSPADVMRHTRCDEG